MSTSVGRVNSLSGADCFCLSSGTKDFPWREVGPGTTLVDVGSGQGSLLLPILKEYPLLEGVAQDRAEVLELTKKVGRSQRQS